MRPSISVTLEPGLDRGVPWGHDLYTFVTSAAGHMMRTLQKPRKNRPSKRQVNHRRFLHNMIQRKFADIEAANLRLASASQDEAKNESLPPSQKAETLYRSGSPSRGGNPQDPDSAHTDGISKSGSGISVESHETEISGRKQPDSGHLWKRHPRSQPTACTDRKNKESQSSPMSFPKGVDYHHGAELLHTESCDDESQLNDLSEDSQTTQQDSGSIQHAAISPSLSPELSPMSLDSCNFSIQMFTDISTQKSITGMSESQWTDIMDLFSVDLGGCTDVEAYFESICACQGDSGQEVGVDDVGFADQSDSFSNRPEVEALHHETGEYQYSCHGDQGLSLNHFQSDQRRQNEAAADTQFYSFKPNQVIIQNHHSLHYNASELQTQQHHLEESPCMLLNGKNNQNFTPFEHVAQSFSVPLPNPEHRPILTLPHEDDWLFTDILKDRRSPDCQ